MSSTLMLLLLLSTFSSTSDRSVGLVEFATLGGKSSRVNRTELVTVSPHLSCILPVY
jgi:hypothetical protein